MNTDAALPVLSLRVAQRLILAHTSARRTESVFLSQAAGRITAEAVRASLPVPHFRQALRDGYALASRDLPSAGKGATIVLQVMGEITAGCIDMPALLPGEAWRIMTGAAVPDGADLVLPQEDCQEHSAGLMVAANISKQTHIRAVGAEAVKGQVLVRTGETVRAELLPRLAAAGLDTVLVHARPRVAVISTGNELVPVGTIPAKGQTVSGNALQLEALVHQYGGLCVLVATVPDEPARLRKALEQAKSADADLVITTGGTGPGRHDLVPQALAELGTLIHYRALSIRPGKSTLFGTLDARVIFALPGPPSAVALLFHALIRPALRKMQGSAHPLPALQRAVLTAPITVGQTGSLHLIAARTSCQRGSATIRPTTPREMPDAVLLIPARRRTVRPGETVSLFPL